MKRTVYMCGVDYQHEIDPDQPGAVPVYTSIENLKHKRTCWKQCGIVKVEIEVVEWVEPQDFKAVK